MIDAYEPAEMDEIAKGMRATSKKVLSYEERWYQHAKVFLPPAELRERHPGFNVAWQVIKEGGTMTPRAKRDVSPSLSPF